MRFLALFFCLLVSIASIATPARAAGLTVDPGRITANEPIAPGSRVALPTYTVTNNLGADARIRVSVSDYRDKERSLPPAEWFRMEPTELLVPAGGSGKVKATLVLPKDAPAGQYKVWFRFASEPLETPTGGIANVVNLQVPLIFDVAAAGGRLGAAAGPKEPARQAAQPEKQPAEASPEAAGGARTSPTQAQDLASKTEPGAAERPQTETLPQPVRSQDQASSGPRGPNGLVWVGIGAGAVVVLAGGLVLRRRFAKRR